jgi:heme-degrading monooxygenase HmoA
MIAHIGTFFESGPQLEEGIRHVVQEAVPSMREAKGFKAGYWMVDRVKGRRVSITIWESADALSAATPAVRAAMTQRREQLGVREPTHLADTSELFEVVAQA